ncbi:MAG: DUF4124 domain-containing protein [Nitrosomonadales bacterium]|nr:DUF4124 domain-containing protein [Nitrosomonadales bacterium]
MSKLLPILLVLASTSTFAAVSKWVDDQGRVHYSDKPPAGIKAETLRTASEAGVMAGAPASSPAAPKTLAEREMELKKSKQAKQAEAEKAAKKQAAEEAKKANCATAQQNLRTLQEGIRMIEVNANGERSYLDDTQRQQRIEKAQQDINNLCN